MSYPWFKLYADTAKDRKIQRLDVKHRWLWIAVLCAACDADDDGRLTMGDLPLDDRDLALYASISTTDVRKGMAEFERLGMVCRDEHDVWTVENWARRQATSPGASRQAKYRARQRDAHGDAEGDALRDAHGDAEGDAFRDRMVTVDTDTDVEEEKSRARKRARGARIPDQFVVTADMRDWVERECPTVDWRKATTMFVNYWKAESGQRATKLDWVRTWKNWMLREAK